MRNVLTVLFGILGVGLILYERHFIFNLLTSNATVPVITTFDELVDNRNIVKDVYEDIVYHGTSMYPSFIDKSQCKVDTHFYTRSIPARGDVVLFKGMTAAGENTELVKRVIGLPFESLKISAGSIYINGTLLSEAYLSPHTKTLSNSSSYIQENIEIKIPSSSYVLLGDNRLHSLDSREFGFVAREAILGKVISCSPPS